MEDADFADLISQAKSGNDTAVRQLLSKYEREIRMMVRVRLPHALRRKYDSMDFVQAVWASFFVRIRERETPFENAQQLGAFLGAIAQNKVYEEHRKRTRTRKYDITKEQGIYERRGQRDVPVEIVSNAPSPSEEAQASDRLRQILAGQGPELVQIVTLRREGLSHGEVATRLHLHESTVRRKLNLVRSLKGNESWE